MFGIEPSPLLISLALVAAVAAVFFLPFLLLTGRRPLTGRGMIAVFVALFGIIIGVNVVMAVTAVRSFPGLEVANSYVASQEFDRERAAQEALGWQAEPVYEEGRLSLKISDAQGLPAPVRTLRSAGTASELVASVVSATSSSARRPSVTASEVRPSAS